MNFYTYSINDPFTYTVAFIFLLIAIYFYRRNNDKTIKVANSLEHQNIFKIIICGAGLVEGVKLVFFACSSEFVITLNKIDVSRIGVLIGGVAVAYQAVLTLQDVFQETKRK